MTPQIRNDDIEKSRGDSQTSPLADDLSSTYSFGQLDFRLVHISDLVEDNVFIKKRLADLEKKTLQLEKTIQDHGLKVSISKYDILNEFIENLIEKFSPDIINDYKILNEFTEVNELLCWIIIPVKKSYKPNDFEEYNSQRLDLFKLIYEITEKFDNCSFTIVSDFEFEEIKNKIEVELEYLISDFI